tara:strand:+ start:6760 stop:7638 length:879 start_codon:yes stop_codon:yes gene_type:complete
MRLKNTVAVITGGASGMGKATALRFLQEGAKVVIADFNSQTGKTTLDECAELGFSDNIRFIKTDVASEPDIEAMLQYALDQYGRLDIVFNNAGVGGALGPLTETTVEAWDYTMNVMAKGVFLGIKHAARIMIERGQGGSIINTASVAALSGDGGPLVYSAAKAAVVSLTKSAAVELARHKIRVNAICPGFILTPLADGGRPEKARVAFAKAQPWPECGSGDDIAGVALFLASEDSRFVTGDHIIVDGGMTAEGPASTRNFPGASAKDAGVFGVNRGSTGQASILQQIGNNSL